MADPMPKLADRRDLKRLLEAARQLDALEPQDFLPSYEARLRRAIRSLDELIGSRASPIVEGALILTFIIGSSLPGADAKKLAEEMVKASRSSSGKAGAAARRLAAKLGWQTTARQLALKIAPSKLLSAHALALAVHAAWTDPAHDAPDPKHIRGVIKELVAQGEISVKVDRRSNKVRT